MAIIDNHQLAAIMFTDIVGYTALMGHSEEKALELLRKNRLIQKPLIEKNHGVWIKEMGDGILARFDSAYNAVKCAIEIQEKAGKKFKGRLRIGLHLGEIILENDDIFGDGVNIASRIESLADPGAIYLSGTFQKALKNRDDVKTQFLGVVPLKNVNDPVEIYYVTAQNISTPSESKISSIKKKNLAERKLKIEFFKSPMFYLLVTILLVIIVSAKYWFHVVPERAINSIAVLPFANLTGDKDAQPIVDMMHDAVIGELSKIGGLRVISRHSTLQFRDSQLTIPEMAKILHVDGIMEASVYNAGDTAFIQVQLIQARPKEDHILSESFERDMQHVRALYGDLAKTIAQNVQIKLTPKEVELLTHSDEIDPLVYKTYLLGLNQLLTLSREGMDKSKEYFDLVLLQEPDHALAHAGLSMYYVAYAQQGHISFFEAGHLADFHAKKALEINANLPEALNAAAFNAWIQWELDAYIQYFWQALEINPNYSEVLAFMGQALVMENMPEEAIKKTKKAVELDPLNDTYRALHTMCLYFTGNYDEAYIFINEALARNPEHPMLNSALRAVCHEKKMYEEEYESWIKKYSQSYDSIAVDALKNGYASGGYELSIQNLIDYLVRKFKYTPEFVPAWQIATLFTRIEKKEEAMIWLNKAYALHSISLPFILIDPLFDFMREDSEFIELINKMNLNR